LSVTTNIDQEGLQGEFRRRRRCTAALLAQFKSGSMLLADRGYDVKGAWATRRRAIATILTCCARIYRQEKPACVNRRAWMRSSVPSARSSPGRWKSESLREEHIIDIRVRRASGKPVIRSISTDPEC
jgi:hypothetical protein